MREDDDGRELVRLLEEDGRLELEVRLDVERTEELLTGKQRQQRPSQLPTEQAREQADRVPAGQSISIAPH